MAYLPTLCEVNYDKSEWWEDTPIPYRYQTLLAKSKDVHQDRLLNSPSFYEGSSYYRNESACNMDPRRPPTVFSTYSNQGLPPSRAYTLPASYYHSEYPSNSDLYVPQNSREGRARTAPTSKSLPNLQTARPPSNLMFPPGGQLGEPREEKKETLKWVPALNTWVVDKNQNPVPYTTFVNSMNLNERDPSEFPVTLEEVTVDAGGQPCGRFLSHMQQDATKIIYAQKQAQIVRKRRLYHDRDDKAMTSRSQPAVCPKSPSRVRFEKMPSPPPDPVMPSLPNSPPLVPPVTPQTPSMEVTTPTKSPPLPRRMSTPMDSMLDPREDLVEGVRDTSLREVTPPIKDTSLNLRKASPHIPTQLPPEPTPTPPSPRKQSTPLPVEDIELLNSPTPSSTPSPRVLAPLRKEPPSTTTKTRSKPEKHKTHKVKAPPKPKYKKKAKSEKKLQSGKNKSKEKAAPTVDNEVPDLVLTIHAQDQEGEESDFFSASPILPAPSVDNSPPYSPDLLSISTDPPPFSPEPHIDLPPVVIRPITARPLSAVSSAHSSDFGDDSSPGSPGTVARRKKEKRVRWRASKAKTEEEPVVQTPEPKMPNFPKRRVSEWMWSDDDDDDFPMPPTPSSVRGRDENSSLDAIPSPSPTPPPTPKAPTPPVEEPKPKPRPTPKPQAGSKPKKKLGPKKLDKSLQEQMEREKLAEERRQKLMGPQRRRSLFKNNSDDRERQGPKFEDYGFLAKYCIFSKEKYEMYRRIFENVDEEDKGWLSGEEVMVALRVVNKALTVNEERYLTRILELTGYKASDGADLKLFAVLAAFSQRITALDEWLRMAIDSIDMQQLDMKMYMCKALWEYNVDPDSQLMPIEQLCLELRAGGVSREHEQEVRHKLSHMHALDLLDFLAYIPLFIMIHESVVTNPLDMSRSK